MKKSTPPAIHPGVVQIKDGERVRWTAAILSGSSGALATVEAARHLVEATLLVRASQPVDAKAERFDSFDLARFCELSVGERRGLNALGFGVVPDEEISVETRDRLTVFANEARKAGAGELGELRGVMRLNVTEPSGPLQEEIRRAAQGARGELSGSLWGEEPGRFSKTLVDHLRGRVQAEIGPDPSGLSVLEDLLVERSSQDVYLIEPVVFQALCDFVCVVAQASEGLEVQWGVCAVDPKTGLSPAPLVRIRDRQGPWHTQAIGAQMVAVTVPWGKGGGDGRVLTTILQRWVDSCVP